MGVKLCENSNPLQGLTFDGTYGGWVVILGSAAVEICLEWAHWDGRVGV